MVEKLLALGTFWGILLLDIVQAALQKPRLDRSHFKTGCQSSSAQECLAQPSSAGELTESRKAVGGGEVQLLFLIPAW